MKKLFIILAALGVFGCDGIYKHHTEAQKEINNIHYYKDTRTNFCFAGQAGNYDWSTLTYVPCSPEVEKLIEPFPDYVVP